MPIRPSLDWVSVTLLSELTPEDTSEREAIGIAQTIGSFCEGAGAYTQGPWSPWRGVDGVGDRRCQAILARNFSVENWERQEERKRSIQESKTCLTLTGLVMEGVTPVDQEIFVK
jgi:hypothetical protein